MGQTRTDPRGEIRYCHTISDKARAIAGGVLEALLAMLNRSKPGSADIIPID